MTRVNAANAHDYLIDQSSAGTYVNMPAATTTTQTSGTVFDNGTQQVQQPAQVVNPECEDGQDDGHISLWSKIKNIGKGIGNFFKGMVCDENGSFSLWQTFKTVAIGVGVGALCVLTAGTAVPAIVAIGGLAMSGYGLVKAGVQAAEAKTDAEAEAAWQSIGSNGTAFGLSLLGTKSLAKANAAAGVEGYAADASKYKGFMGSLRAIKDVGGHALSPAKEAWIAAKAGYSAGGFSEAASSLKSNVTSQFGEFTTTVKGNYNRIAFGTQKNIEEETEALAKQEEKIKGKLDKTKAGSKQHEILQKQYDDIQARRMAMEEINKCNSWEQANTKIEANKSVLDQKRLDLSKATDPQVKAQLGKEIAQLEQQINTQQNILSRRVGEVKAIDDRIATLEKKQTNLDWTKDNAVTKYEQYQTEIEQLQAQRGTGIELPKAPSVKIDPKEYNDYATEYNNLKAQITRGEHVPPTTPEGIAALNKARADFAELEPIFGEMRMNYTRQQIATGNGSYYGHGATEVSRNIAKQFTILRRQNPTAFRLTLATAGRNDEIEQRLAHFLPAEQRQAFFRLTSAQRHQYAMQAFGEAA